MYIRNGHLIRCEERYTDARSFYNSLAMHDSKDTSRKKNVRLNSVRNLKESLLSFQNCLRIAGAGIPPLTLQFSADECNLPMMTALEVTDTFDWSSSGVSRPKILKVKDEDEAINAGTEKPIIKGTSFYFVRNLSTRLH